MIPDISHWKPVRDWRQLKKNAEFVISKATEGTSYIDPTLNSFIRGCEENKIPYYLYTFLRKGNELAQTKFLVNTCKGKVGKHFRGYVLDVECGNSAAGVQAAVDYLKTLGGKFILYTMYSQFATYRSVIAGRGSRCAWWEARYGTNSGTYSARYPAHQGADLHQYTSKGYMPGVGAGVDLNHVTGAKPLSWFVGSSKKEPARKETPKKIISRRKLLRLVSGTMRGKYGAGEKRKKKLGKYYEPVMNTINHIDKAKTSTLITETLQGAYGTGRLRKNVLGRRYMEVQARINLMKKL